MKKLLNASLDTINKYGYLRKFINYSYQRINGFQYGSYTLNDEVALARSFTDFFGNNGGVVIDAGANKGDWSRYFLKVKHPQQKLLIIEPATYHRASLEKLCALNPQVIIVEQVALGAKPDEMILFSDQAGSGLASFYQRELSHYQLKLEKQEVVKVVTLDMLAQSHNLDHIAFLKLDLEGHELEALKGARNLLSHSKIDTIAFEFGGCNIDSKTYLKDFWMLLVQEYKFTFYRVLPGKCLLKLQKYSEAFEQFTWQNILACAPGINPNWKVIE